MDEKSENGGNNSLIQLFRNEKKQSQTLKYVNLNHILKEK